MRFIVFVVAGVVLPWVPVLLADMDGNGWVLLLGGVGGLITSIGAFVVTIVKLLRRDDHTDRRVDLLWEASYRRGQVGAMLNLMEPRPSTEPMSAERVTAELVLKEHVKDAFRPIASNLRRIRRENPNVTPARFSELLEDKFGEWIMRHICYPLKVDKNECMVAAWNISEEGKEYGWDSKKIAAAQREAS
jgi:hypothetical protein